MPHGRTTAVLALLLAAGLLPADPPRALPDGAVARFGGTKLRHADRPTCVLFSPDGKLVYSGGADGAVRAWDVATGQQAAFHARPDQSVESVAFTHGGTRLAANYLDGYIRYLDPATLRAITADLAPTVGRFVFSPAGGLVATRTHDGSVVVDELATGLPKVELPGGPHVAFHPAGKLLAVADDRGTVTVFQVTGGKPLARIAHGGPLAGIAYRPDGKWLATGGTGPNAAVKVWEPGKAEAVAEFEAAGPVQFVGTDRLAATTKTGIGVYDLARKTWAAEARGAAGAFAVSPDGTKLAAVGTGGLRVRLWDLATGKQLHAEDDSLADVALMVPTADGRGLFVIAGDRAIVLPSGGGKPTPAGTFPGAVAAAAVGGKRLVAATPKGVAVWDDFDPAKPLPANPARLIESLAGVQVVAVSDDGKRAACAGDDRRVSLLDLDAGKVPRLLPLDTGVLAMAFLPGGEKLVTHGRDGFLRLWSLGEEKDAEGWKVRVQRSPRGAVAVSPDGKLVAVSSALRVVVVGAADGEQVFAIEREDEDGPLHALAFTPDGKRLLGGYGGQIGSVKAWDVATRKLVRRFSTGLGGVNRLAVFPDGTRAASAGTDEAVTVWGLPI